MSYLLDTHILIWLLTNSSELKSGTRNVLLDTNNTFRVSFESLREITIKAKLNKPDFQLLNGLTISTLASDLQHKFNIDLLSVKIKHLQQLQNLVAAPNHNDPFDHLLISQAISERLTMISADTKFPFYQGQGLKLLAT